MSKASAAGKPDTGDSHDTDVANRRLNPRLEINTKLVGRLDDKTLDLPLANLSYGGAYFDCPQPPIAGEQFELELFNDGQTVASRARVVHSTDEGFAVKFIDPSIAFTTALSRLLTRKLMKNVDITADGFDVSGRIAMLLQQGPDFEVLFTANLGKTGVWVLTDRLWAYSETLWITLLEHGMFDCEVRVLWCTEDAMALEFISPSREFSAAYQRVLDAFMG